jgi:tRNASer (uridine44-2'-O)-methyltransferase
MTDEVLDEGSSCCAEPRVTSIPPGTFTSSPRTPSTILTPPHTPIHSSEAIPPTSSPAALPPPPAAIPESSKPSPFVALKFPPLSDYSETHPHHQLLRSARLAWLPNELWTSVLLTPCAFAPAYFLQVMEHMLRSPNITSSCLFRADILYDSEKDPDSPIASSSADDDEGHWEEAGLLKYMKKELKPRPRPVFDGFIQRRVVVRRLVPRNPQLDKELVQTVWFLGKKPKDAHSTDTEEGETSAPDDRNLIVYIPHADDPDSIPFYHPKVHSIAFQHCFRPTTRSGSTSIHYRHFPPRCRSKMPAGETLPGLQLTSPLSTRLERTALNLLRIVNKHGNGRQAGYVKRVHHDLVVDQATFQDTYTRLKGKYAKSLMNTWAEVTDPQKHVFEDLGIAAFLIEIWKDVYGNQKKRSPLLRGLFGSTSRQTGDRPLFPGFVDIGCGNGVLVYILLSEGYDGWGFDIRQRKSWNVFPPSVQDRLKEQVLVPEILQSSLKEGSMTSALDQLATMEHVGGVHNGIFPSGTFIISNHADQLTPWTPLLAYASKSPFLAIPCCSHALNGKLWRFYDKMPVITNTQSRPESLQSISDKSDGSSEKREQNGYTGVLGNMSSDLHGTEPLDSHAPSTVQSRLVAQTGPGPKSGDLKKGKHNGNVQVSAYAGFTAHIMNLSQELGFDVESEVLRIPSTRNMSVVCKRPAATDGLSDLEQEQRLKRLLQTEIGGVRAAALDWVEGALSLKKKAGGH